MPENVITKVIKYHASFSGNVSDIRVEKAYVPNMSDYYNLLKNIKELQEKVDDLEIKVQGLVRFISKYTNEVEHITEKSMREICDILAENEKYIVNLVKS